MGLTANQEENAQDCDKDNSIIGYEDTHIVTLYIPELTKTYKLTSGILSLQITGDGIRIFNEDGTEVLSDMSRFKLDFRRPDLKSYLYNLYNNKPVILRIEGIKCSLNNTIKLYFRNPDIGIEHAIPFSKVEIDTTFELKLREQIKYWADQVCNPNGGTYLQMPDDEQWEWPAYWDHVDGREFWAQKIDQDLNRNVGMHTKLGKSIEGINWLFKKDDKGKFKYIHDCQACCLNAVMLINLKAVIDTFQYIDSTEYNGTLDWQAKFKRKFPIIYLYGEYNVRYRESSSQFSLLYDGPNRSNQYIIGDWRGLHNSHYAKLVNELGQNNVPGSLGDFGNENMIQMSSNGSGLLECFMSHPYGKKDGYGIRKDMHAGYQKAISDEFRRE